jgi:dihydroxyacid dehydratase/phosphogluconate dehydratase
MPRAGEGGTVSLFGNLSPDGAVLKLSGRLTAFAQASRPRPRLRGQRGSPHRRIDDESFPIDESSVLVLKPE